MQLVQTTSIDSSIVKGLSYYLGHEELRIADKQKEKENDFVDIFFFEKGIWLSLLFTYKFIFTYYKYS